MGSLVVLCGCGSVTDPADVTPEVYVETAEIDPEAAAVFGQERIDDALAELTAFVTAEAFPEALLDPERAEFGRDDLAGEVILDRLTPEAGESWQALVDAALAGDQEAADAVRTVRYYDVEEPWTVREDEPVVTSQEITDVQVAVGAADAAGTERMVVTFDHDATLAFLQDEEPVDLLVEKEMVFELTPAPADAAADVGWLIANFRGEFEVAASP